MRTYKSLILSEKSRPNRSVLFKLATLIVTSRGLIGIYILISITTSLALPPNFAFGFQFGKSLEYISPFEVYPEVLIIVANVELVCLTNKKCRYKSSF